MYNNTIWISIIHDATLHYPLPPPTSVLMSTTQCTRIISTKGVARVQRGRCECGYEATEAMFPHEQFNNSSYCCGAALIRTVAGFILFYITS